MLIGQSADYTILGTDRRVTRHDRAAGPECDRPGRPLEFGRHVGKLSRELIKVRVRQWHSMPELYERGIVSGRRTMINRGRGR